MSVSPVITRALHIEGLGVAGNWHVASVGGGELMSTDYQYDVAFSFNAVDEALATQLNDLLAGRLKTFIYSERQREIAGTDGQAKFSTIFGRTARLVVILYRPEWGQTPWTRVEMDAIKDRSLNEGWDFTTFIPTAPKPSVPDWLPKTRLYVGLERWGIEGAASVIEARAAERGSTPREETAVDRAVRFARAEELRRQRETFERSEKGVQSALKAYSDFAEMLSKLVQDVSQDNIQMRLDDLDKIYVLHGIGRAVLVSDFRCNYENSLDGSELTVDLHDGLPKLPGVPSWAKSQRKRSLKFHYRLVRADYHCWVSADKEAREFSPRQLADFALRTYFELAEQLKAKR